MTNIGENIKKIRKHKKMTQDEFASLIGFSRSYLGDLENNRKNPSADTITKLSKSLGVSEAYLFTGEDDYARNLLKELEKELHEDNSINENIITFILSDVENRLFQNNFPRGYNDRETLEKDFNEYKEDAIELWTNYERLDVEILTRIRHQISSDINDNLDYFYTTTYEKDSEKGKKITTVSGEFVKRLQKLDNFQRAYIDSLRLLDNKEIVKELDKIDIYTDNLNKLQ